MPSLSDALRAWFGNFRLITSARARQRGLFAIWLLIATLMFGVADAQAQSRAEVRTGHAAAVTSIAFAPDGQSFATSSFDTTIKIWKAAEHTEIRTMSGHTKAVFSVAWSADSKFLASASQDRTVRVWNASTGASVLTIQGTDKEFLGARFMPDGKTLATLGIGVLKLWSLTDGKLLRTFQIPQALVWSLQISRDGRFMAWCGGGNANVLDSQSGKILWSFATGTDNCTSVAFSPNVQSLAVPVVGGNVNLYDLHSGNVTLTMRAPDEAMFWGPKSYDGLAFSPDGAHLAGVHDILYEWDVSNGKIIGTSEHGISMAFDVDYAPDGRTIAVGTLNGVVGSIAAAGASDKPTAVASTSTFAMPSAATASAGVPAAVPSPAPRFQQADNAALTPWSAAFTPDGKSIVSVNKNSNDVDFWDPMTGTIRARVTAPDSGWGFVRLSADGKTLVLAGPAGTVVLDAQTHKKLHQYPEMVTHAGLSPDGHFLGYFWPDGNGYLTDLTKDTNAVSTLAPPGQFQVTAFAFSSDSLSVAVGGAGDRVIVRKLDSGKTQVLQAGAQGISALAYSSDGRLLAAATGNGSIVLFDLSRDTAPVTLRKSGEPLLDIAFSPDTRSLATINASGSLVMLSASDGREIARAPGGTLATGNLIFSPDGQRILTRNDNAITIWSAAARPLVSLYAFADGSSVAMTPEGYYEASSERAEDNVSVRVGGALYPVSSYREKFYRPELVRLALQGNPIGQLGRLDQVKTAPRVAILPLPAEVAGETVTIKVRLDDQGGGVGRVRLFVNGSAVIEDTPDTRALPGSSGSIERSYVVHLPPGQNEIKASAFNTDGSMQTTSSAVPVAFAAKQEKAPALYAVVVGIQRFRNPRFDLQNSVADAQLFASTLQEHAAGLYSKVTVRTLTTPEETTRDGISQALSAARTAVGPNDLFVFYVASHGVSDDGEYFLITSNVGSPSTEKLKTDALDRETIASLLTNIPSTKKLVVIDTCQAGALGDTLASALQTRGMSDVTAAKILSRAIGSTVLAATNSEQEALESYQSHGLFTYVVAEGLQGKADASKSGYVNTLQLATYVDDQVPALADKVFQHAQYPTAETNGVAFPIVKAN